MNENSVSMDEDSINMGQNRRHPKQNLHLHEPKLRHPELVSGSRC
ncbi:hypothetical protein [Colwellia hornerae]|nr:hypothetical protein [Colwellia hornerae]